MAELNEPLTERELEVVRLVATGLTNKEVAARLFLSPSTVKVHLNNIFTKLDVHTRSGLTMLAMRSGWIEDARPAEENALHTTATQDEVTGASELSPSPAETISPQAAQPVDAVLLPDRVPSLPRLRVAPNPSPLLRTPLWRKLAASVAVALVLLSAVVPLPSGTASTSTTDGTELASSIASDNLVAGEVTRWAQRAPLPAARARAAAAVVAGRIYVIGGEVNQAASGDVAVFNNKTNTWSTGPQKPTPVWNAAVAAIGQAVYVSGGNTANGAPSNRVELLDTTSEEWRVAAPLPKALAGHSMVEADGKLYVLGGRGVDGVNALVFAYDPASNLWSAFSTLPAPRSLGAAAAVRGRIFLVGGFDEGRESSACDVLTIASVTWSKCPDMLLPRGSLGLARVGNVLFAIGGGRAGYVGFNERFDINGNRWSPFETPITGDWHSIAAASDAGEVYVVGGYNSGRRLPGAYVYEAQQTQTYLPAVTSQGEQK